jgi:hypothetical protein
MTKLLGENAIGPEALETMRARGRAWAAYQNVDLSSRNIGDLRFIQYGEGCTFQEPPKPRCPDSALGFGWQYYYVGTVDLAAGKIIEEEDRHADQSDKG